MVWIVYFLTNQLYNDILWFTCWQNNFQSVLNHLLATCYLPLPEALLFYLLTNKVKHPLESKQRHINLAAGAGAGTQAGVRSWAIAGAGAGEWEWAGAGEGAGEGANENLQVGCNSWVGTLVDF